MTDDVRRIVLPNYLRYAGSALPSSVGVDGPDGTKLSDGRAGHLSFGPNVTLKAGDYVAGMRLRSLSRNGGGALEMDVYSAQTEILVSRRMTTKNLFEDTVSLIPLEFSLENLTSGLEVRLHVENGVLIELSELVIFSRNARSWSGQ